MSVVTRQKKDESVIAREPSDRSNLKVGLLRHSSGSWLAMTMGDFQVQVRYLEFFYLDKKINN